MEKSHVKLMAASNGLHNQARMSLQSVVKLDIFLWFLMLADPQCSYCLTRSYATAYRLIECLKFRTNSHDFACLYFDALITAFSCNKSGITINTVQPMIDIVINVIFHLLTFFDDR